MNRNPILCDRCPTPLSTSIMSRFNEEVLCLACEAQERAHPDYAYAAEVEMRHVQAGNFNFVGVGWPGLLGRVTRL